MTTLFALLYNMHTHLNFRKPDDDDNARSNSCKLSELPDSSNIIIIVTGNEYYGEAVIVLVNAYRCGCI